MEIYFIGTPFFFLFIVFIYLIVRSRQKDRKIEKLLKQLEGMKNRHLTAKGGLSREDSLKMLDLLGKIGMLKDDADLVNLRIEDLEREIKKLLNKKGDKQ